MSFLGLILYLISCGFTPGPNNIAIMSISSKFGYKRAWPFMTGIWTGVFIICIISALFLKPIQAFLDKFRMPLLVIAAIYILYMAYKTLTSKGLSERFVNNTWLNGLLLQFVNPKVYLFILVPMETYIMPHYQDNYLMIFVHILLIVFMGFLANNTWAIFGSICYKLFSKHAKITNLIFALLLVYCAISLFL